MFAHAVAKGTDATNAYKRAGYSENGADRAASRLLRKVEVEARVKEIKANIVRIAEEKSGITKEYVLNKLQENLERALQNVPVYDREGEPTGEYTYQGHVANRALELMGKELGMFKEHLRLSDPNDQPLAGLKIIYVGKPEGKNSQG